jgi:glycosyltransferase involved in cell wall biosynthesis
MTLDRHPLVSIVTPVYNGEQHFRACIESVLAQTYEHWNYTVVNNCSTDRTLEIAREYASKDPRISIHDNETFVPVIANYNIAFRQISPDSLYCKVVAADDWLFPECLERMVALAERHPKVAIVGAFQLCGTGLAAEGIPYETPVLAGRDVARMQLLGGPYVFATPTAVLFRSDIVRSRHAFFNESNLHADDEACVEFLEKSDFGFVHQILSFRRLRDESETSYSERLSTYTPGLLHLLVNHGQKFLTPSEFRMRLREVLRDYYGLLGRQVLKGGDQDFWRYHRAKLAETGYPLNYLRLAAATIGSALALVLNPLGTTRKMLARRKTSASAPR